MFKFWLLPVWVEETTVSALILIIALVIAKLINWILEFLEKVWFAGESNLYQKLISSLRKPIYYLVFVLGVAYLFNRWEENYTGIDQRVFKILHQLIYLAQVTIATFFLLKIIHPLLELYSEKVQQRTGSRAGEEFLILARRVIIIIVLIITLVAVLDHFNIDVKGLLAVLGISSLAFALVAQDTLSNMISGFVLMIDKPFRIGDRVKLASGEIGDVYEIGLRSTKFLTLDNSLIIVPNAELGKSKVTNFSYPDPKIGTKIEIEVALDSDVNKIKNVLLELAKGQPLIVKQPPPNAFLTAITDKGMRFSLVYNVASYNDEFKTQEDLRCNIEKKFKQEKIEIALPQAVVHLKGEKDLKKQG